MRPNAVVTRRVAGLAACVGTASAVFFALPKVAAHFAHRDCCDAVFWCADRVGQADFIDCSFGPYCIGEGMLPWLKAGHGSTVRVLDLAYGGQLFFNPARFVIPEHNVTGDITFQVAATNRLIPTEIAPVEWFVLNSTLQRLKAPEARAVVSQALEVSEQLIVVESHPSTRFRSLCLTFATPVEKQLISRSSLSEVLVTMPDIEIAEETRLGAFRCVVLKRVSKGEVVAI